MLGAVVQPTQPDSSAYQAPGAAGPGRIAQVIRQASARTGVDFSYLLNKAVQESSLDPNAKASTSSATGLYQFTRQTWLQMVKQHGDEYGLGMYADHIKVDIKGVARVDDPAMRRAILELRKNPAVSAEMAGELAKANKDTLEAKVGGKIGPTELYLAHFLGAGGASYFINKMRSDPTAVAAEILPDAAASNPNVFYAKDGTPRSVSQIYKQFAQKFDKPAHVPVPAPSAPVISGVAVMAEAMPPSALSVLAGTGAEKSYSLSHTPSPLAAATGVTVPVKTTMSSLFATMLLAQSSLGTESAKNERDDEGKQKRVLQLLDAIPGIA